jgi:hypothetical protein
MTVQAPGAPFNLAELQLLRTRYRADLHRLEREILQRRGVVPPRDTPGWDRWLADPAPAAARAAVVFADGSYWPDLLDRLRTLEAATPPVRDASRPPDDGANDDGAATTTPDAAPKTDDASSTSSQICDDVTDAPAPPPNLRLIEITDRVDDDDPWKPDAA